MNRPLVISDCDEVLLYMITPFREWLGEEQGVDFDILGLSCYVSWHGPPSFWERTFGLLAERFTDLDFVIAEYGPGAVYDCASPAGIAEAIVETQRAARAGDPNGRGVMSCADLAAYEALVREPIIGGYRGFVVASMPPPSS